MFDGFVGSLQGIIASHSLKVSQIANASHVLGTSQHAERRVHRLVHAENRRAAVNAGDLTKRLTQEAAKRLAWQKRVLLIIDESDLRKPFAKSGTFRYR